MSSAELIRAVGLVPQDPGILLYGESVADECRNADRASGLTEGTTARQCSIGSSPACRLTAIRGIFRKDNDSPSPSPSCWRPNPRSSCSMNRPGALTIPSKDRLVVILHELAETGHAIILATHDVELAARVARRAIVLAEGEVIADGPAHEVVCHSPVFAPQIAKVLAPDEWLTLDEVERALAVSPA